MVPSPADIVRWRAILAAAARLAGLFLVLCAAFPLLSWLIEGMVDEDLWDLDYYGERAMLGLGFIVVGAGLAFAAPFCVRLALPLASSSRCPRCRYILGDLRDPKCPECGLDLPPEFFGHSSPAPAPLSEAVWLVRARVLSSAALRLLAVPIALLTAGFGLLAAVQTMMWGGITDTVTTLGLFALFGLVVPVPMWLLAPLIARLVLRSPRRSDRADGGGQA